jgi:hypothetical protein
MASSSCNICGADATGQCPVCKEARYCGRACQRLAWKYEGHEEKCGAALIEKHHDHSGGGGGGRRQGHKPPPSKEKWEHMAKESKWTPRQRRYFWYRASLAK